MIDKNGIPEDFGDLVIAALDGSIAADQLKRLDEEIVNNPAAREYYIKLMLIHAGLHHTMGAINYALPVQPLEEDEISRRLLSEAIERDEKRREEREAEEARRAAEIKKEEVRQYAEKEFEKFKEDERRRLEKLAYKQYRSRQRNLVLTVGSLAACLVLGFGLWIHNKLTSGPVAPPIVATLIESQGAQWDNPELVAEPGTQLTASSMKLRRGLVKIAFDDGAEVILQAPCRFTLENTNQMFLERGSLATVVPEGARGFTVRTTGATIVDYGTEFGVTTDAGGVTEAHVFKGEVDLRIGSDARVYQQSKRVRAGRAGQVDTTGQLTVKKADPHLFVREQEFEARIESDKGSSYHRWLAYSYQLRRDSSLVAYYTFDNETEQPDKLLNRAQVTGDSLDGNLGDENGEKQPVWTQGRWPEKGALTFDRKYLQHIVVPYAPELDIADEITISAWIYRKGSEGGGHILSKRMNNIKDIDVRHRINYQLSLFNNLDDNPSSFKMQFGCGLFGGSQGDPDTLLYSDRKISQTNQWQHVAVTFDNKTVRFYLNGQLLESHQKQSTLQTDEVPLRIGTDWPGGDPVGFHGLMDEIALFKRVLSAEEIRRMYKAGKP